MEIFKSILFVVAIITAVVFALLVFLTGKGDAMSGGSSVRTSFKGKASFDDFVSKLTFILGIAFMALMIGIDVINTRTGVKSGASTTMEKQMPPPGSTTPGGKVPENKPETPAK